MTVFVPLKRDSCVVTSRSAKDEIFVVLVVPTVYMWTFWRDVHNYINRRSGKTIHLTENYIFIRFERKEKYLFFFAQLLHFLEKFQTHKKRWSDSKPSFGCFWMNMSNMTTLSVYLAIRKPWKLPCTNIIKHGNLGYIIIYLIFICFCFFFSSSLNTLWVFLLIPCPCRGSQPQPCYGLVLVHGPFGTGTERPNNYTRCDTAPTGPRSWLDFISQYVKVHWLGAPITLWQFLL